MNIFLVGFGLSESKEEAAAQGDEIGHDRLSSTRSRYLERME